MRPFSLDEYLKNPNRKIVTGKGNPVRIIHTNDIAEINILLSLCHDDVLTTNHTEIETWFCFHLSLFFNSYSFIFYSSPERSQFLSEEFPPERTISPRKFPFYFM